MKIIPKKVKDIVRQQLQQGTTPQGLALSCAVGAVLGVFPLLGTTTVLCTIVGIVWRLNQPALQAVNYVMAPLQILMMPILLLIGETIFRSEHITLNPKVFLAEFFSDIGLFFSHYGMAAVHAVAAWFILAPLFAFLVFRLTKPAFVAAVGAGPGVEP